MDLFLWYYSYGCFFCHVENDINVQIMKKQQYGQDTIHCYFALKCINIFSTRNVTVSLIFWFVDALDENK